MFTLLSPSPSPCIRRLPQDAGYFISSPEGQFGLRMPHYRRGEHRSSATHRCPTGDNGIILFCTRVLFHIAANFHRRTANGRPYGCRVFIDAFRQWLYTDYLNYHRSGCRNIETHYLNANWRSAKTEHCSSAPRRRGNSD